MRFGVVVGLVGSVGPFGGAAYAQAPASPATDVSGQVAPAATGVQSPAEPATAVQFPTEPPPVAVPPPAPASAPAAPAPVVVPPPAPRSSVPVSGAPGGAEPKPLASWNVGAGVLVSTGAGLGALADGPLYSAVIERRVGARTWLTFDVEAVYDSHETRVFPLVRGDQPERDSIRVYSSNTSLLLGFRQVFVQKLVEVSVTGSLVGGRRSLWRDGLREGETIAELEMIPSKAYSFGVRGGFTFERELIDDLALRLSLAAASLGFTSTEAATIDGLGVASPTSRQTLRAAVALQAGLQLHFYF